MLVCIQTIQGTKDEEISKVIISWPRKGKEKY